MTYLCNDQLTRVRHPKFDVGKTMRVPESYCVGDTGVKNGMPYVVRAFGCYDRPRSDPDWPALVWMVVKFHKQRGWVELLIGNEACFAEKLVRGRHCNPVFNR